MTQRSDDANPFDPFGTMRSLQDANMEAWSKMMQQFVNTPEYSQATGTMLDTYLTTSAPFRKMIEQAMTQTLQQLNMPTRMDVIGIAERLTNIEMRLDDLDAQLTALQRATGAGSRGQEQTQAQATTRSGPGTEAAAAMDPIVEQLSETDSDQSERPTSQTEEQQ